MPENTDIYDEFEEIKIVCLIPHSGNNSHKQKNRQQVDHSTVSDFLCTQTRDRTEMEVNPLVFETSASTNSAIWAFSGCKSTIFF